MLGVHVSKAVSAASSQVVQSLIRNDILATELVAAHDQQRNNTNLILRGGVIMGLGTKRWILGSKKLPGPVLKAQQSVSTHTKQVYAS